MTDPQRIDRMLYKLRYYWVRNKHMNLLQLLINTCNEFDAYNMSDEELEKRLDNKYFKFPYEK